MVDKDQSDCHDVAQDERAGTEFGAALYGM